MPFTVVELRTEVVAALAATGDESTWDDALLDGALRRALRAIDEFGPIYEATICRVDGRRRAGSAEPAGAGGGYRDCMALAGGALL